MSSETEDTIPELFDDLVRTGVRRKEFPGCSLNFEVADACLKGAGVLERGRICRSESMLMSARKTVDAVVARLRKEPAWLLCDSITCEPCTLRKRRLKEQGLI